MSKHLRGGAVTPLTLKGYCHYIILKIKMKDVKESIVTILIVFITVKLIDFSRMNLLDYMIIILAAVYMVISIITWFKKGGRNAKG